MSREEKIELLADLIERLSARDKKEVVQLIKNTVAMKGGQDRD